MDDRDRTDGVRLTARERAALAEIEEGLRQDHDPAPTPCRPTGGRRLPVVVALMLVCSVVLAVVGIRTSEPALLWCFAVMWPLTVLQVIRLLGRWIRTTGPFTPWF
ncbi:DUF3040 domain-containing protein [Streptomyces triticiradicis]|uniref:DUF3040 domain-containing protein n=1 Tax=Streptomyces triticiradicis TaxID=2651189 RepID=A0A7J5DNH8_9ACTN|nr:DUF3040 domain-containing protein [Streptomyces triticiradicis]KAB1990311.1 DUF3040 domain-containing protein [Streptomyces triticiradicis]